MLAFWSSDAVLVGVQAALVAGPRPSAPAWLSRHRTWVWSAVLPLSLVGTVALLALAPRAADLYTWVALVAVPLLTVPALRGWRCRGWGLGWGGATAVGAALFVVAWTMPGLPGQGAAVAMTALSCATLAACLAELSSALMLKIGIVVMASLDAVLVFGQLLEGPNDHLNTAAPAAGLPQLQFAVFGSALVGYGDLFVAAVFGAVLARQVSRRRGLTLAVVTLACSALFDLLFLVVDVLPATVPVAVALLIGEVVNGARTGRRSAPRWCQLETKDAARRSHASQPSAASALTRRLDVGASVSPSRPSPEQPEGPRRGGSSPRE
jgi:hypothetical protein